MYVYARIIIYNDIQSIERIRFSSSCSIRLHHFDTVYIYAIILNIYAILILFRICLYLDFLQIENFLSNFGFLILCPHICTFILLSRSVFAFQFLTLKCFTVSMFHKCIFFIFLCHIFGIFVQKRPFLSQTTSYISIF